ncbi:hypothetical protein D1818_08115 [Aquimarina sp. BL5]|uniref:class I lanthipeptide n=1 Tax=Aquimarina sp. BL5 TaxID=1714860 RepID=UPI000E52D76F|nr:class I lanthipeptide [Aquimarina sp. BL5]AXT50796.1 hypothetical protein D1818_08115 [Aquimarina sp. BL5]RKM90817.1 hypothetical protein D7036_23875 [Aquimarina sp. BL5]
MKKKKFDGLSLNKNVISKLNGLSIKGGTLMSAQDCPTGAFNCPTDDGLISAGCQVISNECPETVIRCLPKE